MRAVLAVAAGSGLLLAGAVIWSGKVAMRGADRPAVQPAVAAESNRRVRLPATTPAIRLQADIHGAGVATQGTYVLMSGTRILAFGAWTGREFTTLAITAADHEFLHLELRADNLHLVSNLGRFGRLVHRAGVDRLLTVDEHDAMRVSQLSTAVDVLVANHAGARPTTESAFEGRLRSTDMEDVTSAAAALDHFSREPSDLPAGFADGRALLADRVAFNAYVTTNPAALADSASVLASMPAQVLSAADLASGLALVGAVHDVALPVGNDQAHILMTNAGGAFHSFARARTNPEFTAAADTEGGLLLVPTHREVDSDWHESAVCPQTQAVGTTRRRLASERFKRLRTGAGVDLWTVTQQYTVSLDKCPSLPETTLVETRLLAGVQLEHSVARPPWAAWEGRRSLPEFRVLDVQPSRLEQWNDAVHVFERGGYGTREGLAPWVKGDLSPRADVARTPFTWSAPGRGRLERDADGIRTRFWLVDAGTPGISGWVHVAQVRIGERLLTAAGYSPIVSVRAGGSPPTFGGDGEWQPAGAQRYITHPALEDPDFRWRFDADGRFTYTGRWPSPGRWTFAGDRVHITHVRRSQGQSLPYHDCAEAAEAGVQDCVVSRARVFQPMADVAGNVAGVERNYVIGRTAQGQPISVDVGGRPRLLREP